MIQFTTLELCMLQLGALQLLKDELKDHESKVLEDPKFNAFLDNSMIPSMLYLKRNIGRKVDQTPCGMLFDMVANIAVEIHNRITDEDKLKED